MQSIDAALFMFAPLMALLFLGVPVAFALITVAAVFGLWHFGDSVVHLFVGKVQEIAASHALAAAPLFFLGLRRPFLARDFALMASSRR